MKVKLKNFLKQIKRGTEVLKDGIYPQIGVRVWGKGSYVRETISGKDTQYKVLFQVRSGDLIINKIWTRNGAIAIVPEDQDGCFVSTEFPTFEIDTTQVDPNWLNLRLATEDFWHQCALASGGTSGKNRIKVEKFLNIEIELPGIERQAEIAKRYASFQVLVNKVSQKIIRSKFLAQRIKANYFSSALKKIDGAYQYDLGDVVSFQRGKSKHRPRNDSILFENGKIPFVQTGNVSSAKNTDFFIKSFDKQYGDLGIQQSKVWPKGTICLTIAANIAEIGILSFDACFPDSVVAVIPSELKIDKDFLFFYLIHLQEKLRLEAPSTAQKNINLAILNKTKIILPPIETQSDISKSMKEIYKYSDSLLSNFRKLNNNIDELSDTFLGKNL